VELFIGNEEKEEDCPGNFSFFARGELKPIRATKKK
jgi:hypothetical protein